MVKQKVAIAHQEGDTTSDVDQAGYVPETAEFFGFQNRQAVFSFDKGGRVISRKLIWPDEPLTKPRDRKVQFTLPIKVRGLDGYPSLPPGLTIVSGPTAVGKSTFVRALTQVMPLRRLLAVEPHDTGVELETLPTFSSIDSALVYAIGAAYSAPDDLYAIDSLRATLFETMGAAGSKGMSMQFFTQITRVSNALAMAGISLMATVNPMDEDPEYVKQFMSKLSASVPATILLESVERLGNGGASFTGSVQMRPNRTKMGFTYSTADVMTRSEWSAEYDLDVINVSDSLSINKAAVAAIQQGI